MKKSKIVLTYMYCREGELIKITRRIIDSMKNNTLFLNSMPALAEIEKALDDYAKALSDAGKKDREKVAIKNDKKAILRELLTQLAYYVTQTCKGDKTLLIGSGFDLNGEKGARKAAPQKLQVELSTTGQVTTRVQRLAKARAYVHQYTADPLTPQSVWVSETKLYPEHSFINITSGSKIWVRVIVINRYGEQIIWDPVSRIVQ